MYGNHNSNANEKLGAIFFITGVAALILSLALYLHIDSVFNGYTQTQATITDIANSSTQISYACREQSLSAWISEYNSSWRIGDTLTVYFDPNNPAKVRSGMIKWLSPAILGGNGFIFMVVGYCLSIRVRRKRQKLMLYGTPLIAEITDVKVNYNIRVNRRHPMRLKCRYCAPDGKEHIFACNVWEPLDESVIGSPITVYVNGDNIKSFHVDTNSLNLPDNTVYHEA